MKPDYKRAYADIVQGIVSWRMWSRLGWQEIKRRYRRTVLGPLWLTLSLGMFIGGMVVIWAPLFNAPIADYLPFITAGLICWTYIATIINEGCATYTNAEMLIKQLNFTLTILNWTLIWRNTVVLFHNLLIAVIVFLFLPVPINWNTLLFLPGLLLVAINGVWISMLLGLISARFRDVPQLVANIVQVMMFVTPVFWHTQQLGSHEKIMNFNPLFHVIEIMRAPLLGQVPSALTYAVVLGGTVVGWFVTICIYARFRRRIAYWM